MTPRTAVLAEALADLHGAPEPVRWQLGAELLYALRLLDRPTDDIPEGEQ